MNNLIRFPKKNNIPNMKIDVYNELYFNNNNKLYTTPYSLVTDFDSWLVGCYQRCNYNYNNIILNTLLLLLFRRSITKNENENKIFR
ncbi:hypothetical protein DERP_008332 [Dermatophagoides pteronyssinus]|uniref:Uncharacterized protein n=1 Tax=Dermatophagoides pteronyssinus TaxID=6956 RepID=A0ABQ8J6T5_DERPT|nr:hypothetical protein DERP_008332 [Dermatophagoides pteronyssinus]